MQWKLELSGDDAEELASIARLLNLTPPEADTPVPYNPDGEAMDVLMYPAGADDAHAHAHVQTDADAVEAKPKAKPRAKPKAVEPEAVVEPKAGIEPEPVVARVTIDHALLRALGAEVMAAHGSPHLVALIERTTGKRSIRALETDAELQAVYDAFNVALA